MLFQLHDTTNEVDCLIKRKFVAMNGADLLVMLVDCKLLDC